MVKTQTIKKETKMELTTNMEDRLHAQNWRVVETFFSTQNRIWMENKKFPGCLILIDEDWSELDRWGGRVVNRNGINDIQLMSKCPPIGY